MSTVRKGDLSRLLVLWQHRSSTRGHGSSRSMRQLLTENGLHEFLLSTSTQIASPASHAHDHPSAPPASTANSPPPVAAHCTPR